MAEPQRTIEVLGPGCARCKEAYRVVSEVVETDGLAFTVVKNESIERIVELGLLATPGVAIDGRVVVSGRVPKREEIRSLLGAA